MTQLYNQFNGFHYDVAAHNYIQYKHTFTSGQIKQHFLKRNQIIVR